jgi:hypothetical protein
MYESITKRNVIQHEQSARRVPKSKTQGEFR